MGKKKLTKAKDDKVISGVMAGLAEYFSQDPLLFRIGAIIFMIATGFFPGVFMYIIMWLLMPEGKSHEGPSYTYDIKD